MSGEIRSCYFNFSLFARNHEINCAEESLLNTALQWLPSPPLQSTSSHKICTTKFPIKLKQRSSEHKLILNSSCSFTDCLDWHFVGLSQPRYFHYFPENRYTFIAHLSFWRLWSFTFALQTSCCVKVTTLQNVSFQNLKLIWNAKGTSTFKRDETGCKCYYRNLLHSSRSFRKARKRAKE